jgi:hypothetical protein
LYARKYEVGLQFSERLGESASCCPRVIRVDVPGFHNHDAVDAARERHAQYLLYPFDP